MRFGLPCLIPACPASLVEEDVLLEGDQALKRGDQCLAF